jgi:hypothetical protein
MKAIVIWCGALRHRCRSRARRGKGLGANPIRKPCCNTCEGVALQGVAGVALLLQHHHPLRGVGCSVAGVAAFR